MNRPYRSIFCLAVLLGSVSAWAGDGKIPIYQRTNITESGHYVVTRDISSNLSPILVFADNVTIDLNGHTLSSTVPDGTIRADNANGLVVKNGRLVNESPSGRAFWARLGGASLMLENLHLSSTGNTARLENIEGFTIRNLRLRNGAGAGLYVTDSHGGIIEDIVFERVEQRGIALVGSSSRIRVARVTLRTQVAIESGIDLYCTACSVEDSIIEGSKIGILLGGQGARVSRNVLRDCEEGILVYGTNSRITDNLIGSTVAGIRIGTSRTLIEGNQLYDIGGASCGLHFLLGSTANLFRANVARGHSCTCSGTGTTDYCDENASGNTSHGDNYLPGPI